MARGPKSHHADGTPKKRWTAEERAARGRPPRRRGGRPKGDERSGATGRGPAPEQAGRRGTGGPPSWKKASRTGGPRKDPARKGDPRADARESRSGKRFRDDRTRQGFRDDRSGKGARADRPRKRAGQAPGRDAMPYGRRGADSRTPWQRDERRPRRDDARKPWRKDARTPRRDDARRGSAPDPDQMAWEATSIRAESGVVNAFTELGVADALVGTLAAQGITEPFAIQEATIRDAVEGRDVLGRARTGSGKTLAFGLPLLTRLAAGRGPGPRAVVLSPTRELAMQIADVLAPLAHAVGLDLTLVAGGMAYGPQIRAFERGVDVVVATPGRLVDLMQQGAADLGGVEVTVLDEADHMAEMGFTDEVTAILDATPTGGQRLLYSATLDEAVDRIVQRYLEDPIVHEVDTDRASVTAMTHLALHVQPHHKNAVTAELAAREGRTVLFARTQKGTDRIAGQLRAAGVMAGALHGGLTQGARARILRAFRAGDVPVLVATDVAARGIHVDDVSLVVQVDPPRDAKDYLHRAGRTARAGTAGTVATIVLPHQRKLTRRLLGQAGVEARRIDVTPGAAELGEATGARPPSGEPIDDARYQELIRPRPAARRSGPPRRRGFRPRGQRGPRRGRR